MSTTPVEALHFNRRRRAAVDALLENRNRSRILDHRFAVIAASAHKAGHPYTELAEALGVKSPAIPAFIEKQGAQPDEFLVKMFSDLLIPEPGLSLREAADALGIGRHAVMARARAGTMKRVKGKRGYRYFIPETANGSDES